MSPSTIGMVLLKRKEFEAGLQQGINLKRNKIRTPKTAGLNEKVVDVIEKCNAKGNNFYAVKYLEIHGL